MAPIRCRCANEGNTDDARAGYDLRKFAGENQPGVPLGLCRRCLGVCLPCAYISCLHAQNDVCEPGQTSDDAQERKEQWYTQCSNCTRQQ